MIDKKRIETEAEHFFEWPTADRTHVTRTSMLIFAGVIAEMVRKESADRIEQLEATNLNAANRVIELTKEVMELRKDAERYRWIRHGDNDESVLCGDCRGIYLPRNERLDKAIDDKLELERITTYLTQDRVLHGGGPAIDEAMK